MPYNEIRAIDRSCGSYRPDHQVHWIQAKKSVEEQQPVIDVAVVVHDDGRVDIHGDDLNLTAWSHDRDRLQSAVDYRGRAVWKPRYHVLNLPGVFGSVFNLAALEAQSPCLSDGHQDASHTSAEAVVDRAVRDAIQFHGFTAPLGSIRLPMGSPD